MNNGRTYSIAERHKPESSGIIRQLQNVLQLYVQTELTSGPAALAAHCPAVYATISHNIRGGICCACTFGCAITA